MQRMKTICQYLFSAAMMLLSLSCQEPQNEDVNPNPTPDISISPTAVILDAEGSAKSITVSANYDWEARVVEGEEWLTVEPASGKASEAFEVRVSAAAYAEETTRKAEVLFSMPDATARLIVNQRGKEPEESEEVNPNPNPDAYIPQALYIVGDPTDFGWNRAVEGSWMTKHDDGTFTWSGNLHTVSPGTGGFKFLEYADQWDYGFCRDDKAEDYWTIAYRTPDNGVGDVQFHVDKSGLYEVKLDAVNLTLEVELIGGEAAYIPQQLFLVGDGTDFGWDVKASNPEAWMTKGEDGNFTWEGNLYHTGRFKFIEFVNYWDTGYNRDATAAEYWTLVRREGGPDEQFVVDVSGLYRIELNVVDLTISAELLKEDEQANDWGIRSLYVIGDAMSAGWDPKLAVKMEQEGNIFTWTGELNANTHGFKFLCRNDGSWVPGINRDASAAEYWTMAYRGSYNDPDEKFHVSESGTYTITINLDNFTIVAERQD